MIKAPSSIPFSLFTSNRAQCPDCGAPLPIDTSSVVIDCGYCGCHAAIERRLRTFEADVGEGIETATAPPNVDWRPSHLLEGASKVEGQCPTCGAMVKAETSQDQIQCNQCGTRSKFERRLVRGAAIEIPEADDKRTAAETNRLINQLKKETELPKLAAIARAFDQWCYINHTMARRLPEVLQVLQHAPPEVAHPLSQIICKLLCEGNPILRNSVLRAAEKFVFDPSSSPDLLFELGMGSGVCLKLLLDVANFAADAGAMEYAATALWACNWIFERHYEHREVCGEIILYRLLYMKGPVQAWALQVAQGQMGLGYRYPTPTLLRFIDDCHFERPDLIPHVRKCFYSGWATTDGEWLLRVESGKKYLSAAARESALRELGGPPEGAGEKTVAKMIDLLLGLTNDADGGIADAAGKAIVQIVEAGPEVRKAVHEMVRVHGESLPEDVRRAYFERVRDTKLIAEPPRRYWEPEKPPPKTAFDEQLEAWHNLWKESLIRAVDARHVRQQKAKDYWDDLVAKGTAPQV